MLNALVAGTRDPEVLAELAKGTLRKKIPQLRDALEGRFGAHHGLLVGQILAKLDFLDEVIANLSVEIDRMIAAYEPQVALLVTIPGIDRRTAQELIAEIGVDMSRFPTAGHLASWAGMCPGHHESAGKRRSGHTRPGSKWLHRSLREAAKAAGRTKNTYLGAQYARLRGRRGPAKATTAVGHSILVAAYHMLRDGVTYNELGPDWFDRLSPDQHARRLARQIEALGFTVTISTAA
jgi:transposase